uniref:Uncharacterized protein n=1 Tax=Cucumis melo TaxID=3656 RepID=A0A9I9E3L9_CUCME
MIHLHVVHFPASLLSSKILNLKIWCCPVHVKLQKNNVVPTRLGLNLNE